MSEATLLVPEYTFDDFLTEAPYQYIYQQKDNKFLLTTLLQKMSQRAKQVKYTGFMATWRSYLSLQQSEATTILGENETMFDEQPEQLSCGSYTCTDSIKRLNEYGVEVEVISHPIMPVKRVIDIDSNTEKLDIAYRRGGTWKNLLVGRECLASAQKIVALAKHGIGVNSENAKELVRFITDIESRNYDRLAVQKSTEHCGWLPNGEFAPYCKDIVYGGDSPEFERIFNGFKQHGDMDTWLRIAHSVRSGRSVPARIALAASFSAPLVSLCGALPFFVHLWGTQGCGKTVGLMLAASVWGNPDIGAGYIKSFGGTKVSQELYAAFCSNVPVLLDELQVISDRKQFDDLIYMLCEGMSKGRGAKEGGLQLQRRWSTCMITTGEMPIVQSNSGGGAAVRTIEVNYGGEPLFEDARGVANTLKENYGFAGPIFVGMLKGEEQVNLIKSIQKQYYSKLSGSIQDKQVLSASLVLAADELADMYIFHDGCSLTVDDIRPYLVTQEEADVNRRCYDWLMGYIAANPRRFDNADENAGETWGKRRDDMVYIIKPIFERILRQEGYSPGAFITWAKRKKKLVFDDYGEGSGNRRLTKRVMIGGRSTACIAIIDSDGEKEGDFTEVDSDDVPF